MEGQIENSYLLQMPLLVIENILSNILNLSNVSRTCQTLYEIVCQMEKRKRVMCIRRLVTPDNPARLTIDDDAMFNSIMNSLRTITEIKVDVEYYLLPDVELNERQLERLNAIMKHFGTNITSLMLGGISLSIDKIIELLNRAPILESLEFVAGKALGCATTSLHLSSLKKLVIRRYPGLSAFIDLLPAGSLNDFFYFERPEDNHTEILQTILSKQFNMKTLRIYNHFVPHILCVNHLQLEKLELGCGVTYNNDQLVEMLKCHTNLKELKLLSYGNLPEPQSSSNSVSAFKWICDNLNELEVLHVPLDSQGINIHLMLAELKKLRYFSTNVMHCSPDDEFQIKIDSLDKLKITTDYSWWFYHDSRHMLHSMVRTFTNLTALEISLADFSELCLVLNHCTTLIHLTSFIEDPSPDELNQKCFPNIRHLTISTYTECDVKNGYEYDICMGMSVITSIVRAMPHLKSLWLPCTTIIFNINAVKEFIVSSKSLEDLNVDEFKLNHEMSATDDFVDTIRRLSDQLKAYRFTFTSNGHLYSNTIKGILANEFNVQGGNEVYKNDSTYFNMCKGVLSKFRGYL